MTTSTGVFDEPTQNAVTAFQRGRHHLRQLRTDGIVDADTWAAIEEYGLVRDAPPPRPSGVVDDLSDAHKAAVAAVVNRHIDLSLRRERGVRTVRAHLIRARDSLTRERNVSDDFSRSILLRDAQRYFYGRLAPYTDAGLLRDQGEGATRGWDEVFHYPPSDVNVKGIDDAQHLDVDTGQWSQDMWPQHMDTTNIQEHVPVGSEGSEDA